MNDGFWVFGYGSLLWNPGFQPQQTRLAVLAGYKRSFCMWSHHHRGTPDHPGLVLALDRSDYSTCRGMALKVSKYEADETLANLRKRELISYAYKETEVELEVAELGRVTALAYVVDPRHHQYCLIGIDEQAKIIATAVGGRGDNRDYLEKTVAKLIELGIGDPYLDSLLQRVRILTCGGISGQ